MTGQQLIDLTHAKLRQRRLGKPAVSVHPFFKTWMKGHRADLRQAFAKPSEEIEIDLEQLWRDCGFTLNDEILLWWAQHADRRGFEGDGLPPWHDDELTGALLTRARDWEPRPAADMEPSLSWSERRRCERELLAMERKVASEVVKAAIRDAVAWGRIK